MTRPPSEYLSIGHASTSFEWTGLPGWSVLGYFRSQGGEWVIEELTIKPRGLNRDLPPAERMPKRIPKRGVTSELLRSVNLSGIRTAIAQHMVWASSNAAIPAQVRPSQEEVRTSDRTSRTRGRLDDAFLQQVAAAWLEEVERGGGAYARMVARFAQHTSSEQTVKGWLAACRDRGWLAKSARPNQGRGRREAAPGRRLLAAGWRPRSIGTTGETP